MPNLHDYINWRGDISLKADLFNEIDNLIFCQFCYMPFEGVDSAFIGDKTYLLGDLSSLLLKAELDYYSNSPKKNDLELLKQVSESNRFKNQVITQYVNNTNTEEGIQFSASTILTDDDYINIIFRGTDGTIVGWEEDFKLSFNEARPCQISGVNYLVKISELYQGKIRLMGHSKGGNIALYAAAHAPKSVQDRITIIYADDAPGFSINEVSFPGFSYIQPKIKFFVPTSSVIGMLLLHNVNYNVIKSDGFSILQHVPYTWQVERNMFIPGELSKSSEIIKKTLHSWYMDFKEDNLKIYVNTIFKVIYASGISSIQDLSTNTFIKIFDMVNAAKNIDSDTKKIVNNVFKDLLNCYLDSIKDETLGKLIKTKE